MEQTTKEIEIEYGGKPEKIVIREFTLKDRNDIYRAASTVKFIGKDPIVTVDMWSLQEQSLLKGIITAPFPITSDSVLGLRPALADKIYAEIETINNMTDIKKAS
jgi:hypothetical protein